MSPLQIFYRVCFPAGVKTIAIHSATHPIFLSVNQGESLVYVSLSIRDTDQQDMLYPGNPVQILRRLLAIREQRVMSFTPGNNGKHCRALPNGSRLYTAGPTNRHIDISVHRLTGVCYSTCGRAIEQGLALRCTAVPG